jgi:hypothetical protein
MEIHNWHDAPKEDWYIGEFSIYFDKMDWWQHKVKVARSKKGSLYLKMPSYSTTDEMGAKKWHESSHPGEKRRDDFRKQVMELIDPFVKSTGR